MGVSSERTYCGSPTPEVCDVVAPTSRLPRARRNRPCRSGRLRVPHRGEGNNLAMRMRDHLGSIFDDQQFADLFSATGQPAVSPHRLALTTILQFTEGLSDQQAADAVRTRIDWKFALSLELTDPGFDSSVLCEFRSRLIAGGRSAAL